MNEKHLKKENLDIIIPISFELSYPTYEQIVANILELYNNYGFNKFALIVPCGGWRSIGYPSREYFRKSAELFLNIKEKLLEFGIVCGWWNALTLKGGHGEEFVASVYPNGNSHPFAICPLDPTFRKRFSEDIALFAKIAKPAFIILEDDFTIKGAEGCFCQHHLQEFSARQVKNFSRTELVEILNQKTPESFEITRKWRELLKDSLVGLAKKIREEVDKDSPEIPIGSMQTECDEFDGDCTEAVAKALAGANHTPFSRIHGAVYGSVKTKDIPTELYYTLYRKQHIKSDFKFYHESDTFPHTRFFTPGAHMRSIMGTVYSYGFDGSIFIIQQYLDYATEETVYGKMFCEEKAKFKEVQRIAKQSKINGVQICYDPFWNTIDETKSTRMPLWVKCLSRFGIPYTSLNSKVTLWDERQAKYADDTTIKDCLSKGLILDGEAAKSLCKRGYGKYLGIEVGDDVFADTKIKYDLGMLEIIREEFSSKDRGRYMPPAFMFCPSGTGKLLNISITDEKCEVVSEMYTSQKKYVCPAMTRFKNELGGKVVVLGLTLNNNNSQALFNYRRQRLLQDLIAWCSNDFVFVKETPDIFVIENRAINPEESNFFGMLTLINYCEDDANSILLHLPPYWQNVKSFCVLNEEGKWQKIDYSKTEDGITIYTKMKHLTPIYILGQ